MAEDRKIVTAGQCAMGGATGNDACLARYNTDGSLDTSFDTDGRVTTATAPTTNFDAAYSVAVQTDGKLVTAGQCNMGGATGFDSCLARYNADGSLDTTFDTDGRVTTATAPTTNFDAAYSVAVQTDGKLVTTGQCIMGGSTGNDACLASYDQGGRMVQYQNGVADWDQGASTFGACLASVAGGATAQWTANAACPATDGAYWNAVPATATKIAYASAAGTVAATANLRFGVRTSTSQPPGAYIAPITFDVLAPNT